MTIFVGMENLTAFVQEHINDDITRLVLDRARWPEIDMDLAIACIECRRKLKNKVKEWYSDPELIFPIRLSAEQCSSSATGHYKAEFARQIAGNRYRIVDLTGGLGVDSWYFSHNAEKVIYNEMLSPLAEAASHNFKVLGRDNILVSHRTASSETIPEIMDGFLPDIVYMDPARRGEGGKKVFLIEECTPDVLTIKDVIFKYSRHILLKLSPMADITMACERLGRSCREVHVVATSGECKELLIWMDREWTGEYTVTAVELGNDYPDVAHEDFRFLPSEEKSCSATLLDTAEGMNFLFEPGKAMMKSGCFNLLSERMGIMKLGRSTHYYLTGNETIAKSISRYGKVFEIINCVPLDKRSIKEIGRKYPHSEVSARNIPMDTETLRKKLGVTSGDDAHIFGLKSDLAGNLLIVTKRSDALDGEGQARP